MAVLNTGLAKTSASGYEIDNSLRFNDDDSAYLSRTPSSAGNRKTWTWSGWVKRGNISDSDDVLFGVYDGSNQTRVYFLADDKLQIEYYAGSASTNYYIRTNQLFRDSSAWYHIVAIFDTTQAVEANRLQLWVNGERITSFSVEVQPTLNFDGWVNDTKPHFVGGGTSDYLDGYLAEVNFVDGQALTPADFGETGDYGEWKPIEYEGTYGTNGFYLSFAGGGIIAATGGTITTDGDYKVHSFTSNGTFTPSAAGEVEYLVIAGGGGGGSYGGGGAGGYRTGYLAVTAQAYSITVGTGGAGSNANSVTAVNGTDSVFSTITSIGGGNGGGGNNTATRGTAGGSGGGGNTDGGDMSGGAGTSGQGNAGGSGATGHPHYAGGGGGGSNAAGGNASSHTGGTGGAGTASSITGASVTRAGGGGGSGYEYPDPGTGGSGGSGGGGNGTGWNSGTSTAGTANTGSGGGSNGEGTVSNGGSGIVIIRYKFQ